MEEVRDRDLEIRLIVRFGYQMMERLDLKAPAKNRVGWRDEEVDVLFSALVQEVGELAEALRYISIGHKTEHWEEQAILECADVANFSMMLVDRFGRLDE